MLKPYNDRGNFYLTDSPTTITIIWKLILSLNLCTLIVAIIGLKLCIENRTVESYYNTLVHRKIFITILFWFIICLYGIQLIVSGYYPANIEAFFFYKNNNKKKSNIILTSQQQSLLKSRSKKKCYEHNPTTHIYNYNIVNKFYNIVSIIQMFGCALLFLPTIIITVFSNEYKYITNNVIHIKKLTFTEWKKQNTNLTKRYNFILILTIICLILIILGSIYNIIKYFRLKPYIPINEIDCKNLRQYIDLELLRKIYT